MGTLILMQFVLLSALIFNMARQFLYIYIILNALSLVIVLYIAGNRSNPAYKLAWTGLILFIPLFGGIFYLFFGSERVSASLKKKIHRIKKATPPVASSCEAINLNEKNPLISSQIKYLDRFFPVYNGEKSYYFKTGEECFEKMLAELKKAEKYIFIEYFIIAEGVMWDAVISILKEKSLSGVDVRIIYDDCGCLGLLPTKYPKYLAKYNIKCRVFNPLKPSLTVTMNNRNHRKIMVIDGKTAFTGGINLADEYINEKELHGHWKDNGVMVTGKCVNSFVNMFLEMWSLIKYENINPKHFYYEHKEAENDGYIQPYADNPYDEELIGENVYLNIINKAQKELYIITPYLILDNELTSSLILAKKSGVKISIITPGIADKWYVHTLTRSSYENLIKAGIDIYEYTPGFIHGKVFLCDDVLATVGSVNLDYRSLYLHFECGVVFYRQSVIKDIKADILDTIKKSRKISASDCKKNIFVRILRSVLRLLAPLM